LNTGSALGKGVGPLVISNNKEASSPSEKSIVALPGENTTANLLFSFAYPNSTNKKFMIFSGIEDSVLANEADYGVIIHENRFTYQQRGLQKVTDLGEYWEQKKKLPIPLGGIAFKRSLGTEIGIKVERLIKSSLEYAFSKYPYIPDFVKQHSQDMNEDVMRKHIDLYVNDYTLDLTTEGRKAIIALREVFESINTGMRGVSDIFLGKNHAA
jgi:1,4-dihydroxy-6-naphthoate synthase